MKLFRPWFIVFRTGLLAFYTLLCPSSIILANGAGIIIDGNFDDWNGIRSLVVDPAEGAIPCDWRKGFFANDSSTLFIRYLTQDTIDFNFGAAFTVLLDTDQSKQTGFRGGDGTFAVGAEYLLQGLTLYKYTGTGLDWSWETLGTVDGKTKKNDAEFAIPLAKIGTPKAIDIMFYADNMAGDIGGIILDLMPDNAMTSADGKVTYKLK